MPTPLNADALVRALLGEGVRVVEHLSWRTNNRNHAGDWGPVHGVMIHHTVTSGTAGSVSLCYGGRADLPGPLCHGVIAKDGTVYLVGNGRANHAGLGDGDVLQAVIQEQPLPQDNEADTDGNRYFYGFEAINLGDNEDLWPPEQVEAIVRVSAALCRTHEWTYRSVIGHLEWQPGKVDPRGPGISMGGIRSQVLERLQHESDWDGVEEMPKPLALGMTIPFELGPGSWVSLPWDTEWSDGANQHYEGAQTFASNGAQYNGVIWLYAEGLGLGQNLSLRLVDSDSNGTVVRELPISSPTAGNESPAQFAFPISGQVSSGQRVKATVHYSGPDPITILRAEIKAQIWP